MKKKLLTSWKRLTKLYFRKRAHTETNGLVNRQNHQLKIELTCGVNTKIIETKKNFDNWREAAKLTDESFENDNQQFLENKYLWAEEVAYLNQSSKIFYHQRYLGEIEINTAELVNK